MKSNRKKYCYSLNRLGTQENDRLIRLDKEKRKREERFLGIKFTDYSWFEYKMKFIR